MYHKYLTQQSAFLELLEPGDIIMANRRFSISEDFHLHRINLEILFFTCGQSQLRQNEVEFSQRLMLKESSIF